MTAAALEAQGELAQITGMAEGAAGNFVGPDGRTYTMVFAAVDALAAQAAGMDMQSHGFGDKSFVIATATRDQFSAPPLGWRRAHGSRLVPSPAADCLILSVGLDDPFLYTFAMALRQPITGNG